MVGMVKDRLAQAWRFATSTKGQGILKCSVAYLLACQATFLPPIANFLGHQDGKHMSVKLVLISKTAPSPPANEA